MTVIVSARRSLDVTRTCLHRASRRARARSGCHTSELLVLIEIESLVVESAGWGALLVLFEQRADAHLPQLRELCFVFLLRRVGVRIGPVVSEPQLV
eukprot:CAMPEP_0206178630 /NCGR_PEP_ID=MMETSP1474-20131121/64870_1 /ASSEMBLY_ACC=CAM_ASM_001110 /TAXON_ID=97495 /ORGANISM="Imantonia sp., Strain RCC918" /LENGTH=96 /DNA_ID=CAMNT_0053591251 /DNA_START=447 /DNA_END=733 /DNA_ORIENTATION=-